MTKREFLDTVFALAPNEANKIMDAFDEYVDSNEPHWIPVTEEPPEVGKSVLICDAYGDICLGHRTHFGYYYPDFCEDKNQGRKGLVRIARTLQGGDRMIDEDAIMRIAIIYALISIIGIMLLVIV